MIICARCRAYVRLLTSQNVVKKDYEDVCSFAGKIFYWLGPDIIKNVSSFTSHKNTFWIVAKFFVAHSFYLKVHWRSNKDVYIVYMVCRGFELFSNLITTLNYVLMNNFCPCLPLGRKTFSKVDFGHVSK